MGSTLNNRSTKTEPLLKNGQQPKAPGGLKCILLALDIRPRFCCCCYKDSKLSKYKHFASHSVAGVIKKILIN